MNTVSRIALTLSLYAGSLLPSYASVSGEDDWDNKSLSSVSFSDSNVDINSVSSHGFSESIRRDDTRSVSSQGFTEDTWDTASNLIEPKIEKRGQKLNEIIELKIYFKAGFLEISPQSYERIASYIQLYGIAFENYNRGISLKEWSENNNLEDLKNLLRCFNKLTRITCIKNSLPSDKLVSLLQDVIQHHETLESLKLEDISLSDKEVKELLKVLPPQSKLRRLNVKTSVLSPATLRKLKNLCPNLIKLKYKEETTSTFVRTDDKANFTLLSSSTSLNLQAPIVTSVPHKISDSKEGLLEAPVVHTFTQELTYTNILDALKKVRNKSMPYSEFATFINSDPTLTNLTFYTSINAEEAQALAAALEKNTTITKLNFLQDSLTTKEASALLHVLKRKKRINVNGLGKYDALLKCLHGQTSALNLSNAVLTDSDVLILLPLLKELTHLTQIDLSGNKLNVEGLKIIAPIFQVNESLTDIDLSKTNFSSEGVETLLQVLKHKKLTNIKGLGKYDALLKCLHGQTSTLNLSNAALTARDITTFMPLIKDLTHLTQIDLSESEISDEGIKALAPALQVNTSLGELNLANTGISDESTEVLANAIKENNSLTIIDLSGNKLDREGTLALIKALKGQNGVTVKGFGKYDRLLKNFQSQESALDLSHASLSTQDALIISALIESLPHLRHINLYGNNLGDEGIKALAPALQVNTSLRELNLANTGISDESTEVLANAIKENNSLTIIDLSGNMLSIEGIKALAPVLQANTSLRELNLTNIDISDDGVLLLLRTLKDNKEVKVEGLRKYESLFQCLQRKTNVLNLSNNGSIYSDLSHNYYSKWTDENITTFMPLIKDLTHLTQIDLSGSKLSREGITALAPALQVNTSLRELNLTNIDISDDGVLVIIRALKGKEGVKVQGLKKYDEFLKYITKQVSVLDLSYADLMDNSTAILSALIESLTHLAQLNIIGKKFGDKEAKSLASAIGKNNTLTKLNFEPNEIGNEGIIALMQALKSKKRIKVKGLKNTINF